MRGGRSRIGLHAASAAVSSDYWEDTASNAKVIGRKKYATILGDQVWRIIGSCGMQETFALPNHFVAEANKIMHAAAQKARDRWA